MPDGPPPLDRRPDYTVAVDGARHEDDRRRTSDWGDIEVCVDAVARFLADLGPNGKDSRLTYVDWSIGREGAPPAASLRRHGGYAAVRDLARHRLEGEQGNGAAG